MKLYYEVLNSIFSHFGIGYMLDTYIEKYLLIYINLYSNILIYYFTTFDKWSFYAALWRDDYIFFKANSTKKNSIDVLYYKYCLKKIINIILKNILNYSTVSKDII